MSDVTTAESIPPRGLAASRVSGFAPAGLTALLKEARNHDAVDLALGTPGTPTPPAMVDAACAALRDGRNQYEVLDGNAELRGRIAAMLTPQADPLTEVTVTVGATEALAVALLSTVDPGDEVIVFEPFYENFVSAIALAGGVPRFVRVHPPEWRYDPDELAAAFGPRTRAVVLNTPSNPTGRVLGADELAEIGELCERWDVTAISDEVYAGYLFDGHEHVSAAAVPGLRTRSVVVGSLSKSHSASGWRIGFLRAEAPLTEILRRVHVAVTGGTAAPLQEAVARAAALDADFGKPRDDLVPQRERVTRMFEDLGADCIAPEGGCYVIADVRPLMDDHDSEAFAYRLVEQTGVLVAPGRYFYASSGGGAELVRIAFNRPLELLDEAERRLAALSAGVA